MDFVEAFSCVTSRESTALFAHKYIRGCDLGILFHISKYLFFESGHLLAACDVINFFSSSWFLLVVMKSSFIYRPNYIEKVKLIYPFMVFINN